MLGTVSSPIAQRAAAKRAAEAPRADAPGARHQKGAQSRFLTVALGTLRCRPFAPRHGVRQSKLNVYCSCVCVCVCVCARARHTCTRNACTHTPACDHFIHLSVLCILQAPEMMPHEPVPADICASITAGGTTATENMPVIVPAR